MTVVLVHAKKQIKCSLRSCTPVRIQQIFGVEEAPSLLFFVNGESTEAICWDEIEQEWDPPLIPACSYHISSPHTNKSSNRQQSTIPIDVIQQAIQCAIALSQPDPAAYLKTVLKHHTIDSTCISTIDSPISYGIFTCSTALCDRKQIFIAFRGTTNRDDVTRDIEALGIDKFTGKVHSGFWKRAALVPIEPFIDFLADGNELIFCGHSMGGAVAQLVVLNLFEHYSRFKETIPSKKLFSVSIGSPLLATSEVNTWINSINCHHNFLNIINPEDFVARLLDPQILNSLDTRTVSRVASTIMEFTPYAPFKGPVFELAKLSIELAGENLPSYLKMVQNAVTKAVPLMRSFVMDYKPLGTFGILKRTTEAPGGVQFTIEENIETITKLLSLSPNKVAESQIGNHFIISYWEMMLELSNNNQKYKTKEFSETIRMTSPDMEYYLIPRQVKDNNIFSLLEDTKIVISKNQQENRCKLVIHGNNLCFLVPEMLHVSGIPISRSKSGIQQITMSQIPPASTRAEFQCHLDPEQLFAPYPTVEVVTHFDHKIFNISAVQYVEGLTKREKTVDILSLGLFQKAYQRGLSEMILFNNNVQLKLIYNIETITLHSTKLQSALEKDPKLARIVGTDARSSLIHQMMNKKEVQDTLLEMFEYFATSLVLRDKQNKRTFALYMILGGLTSGIVGLSLPITAIPIIAGVTAGAAGGAGANLLRHRFKREIEWNNITVLRSMLDELRVDPRNKTLCELESSSIEYDCMMLEKALSKKSEPLKVLTKSVEDLVNSSLPIFPTWKDKLSPDSYIKAVERLKASCLLYQLRLQLTKQFFLGIVGPQNAGKTTLTNMLLGKMVGECGDDKHTENANIYKVTDELIIVDFAGQTSTEKSIANIANQCGAMVSGFIYLTDFRGDPENTNSTLIEQIARFHCPILLCVNQVSRRLDSIPNRIKSEYYKNTWNSYINSYLQEAAEIHQKSFDEEMDPVPLSTELTEFRDFNNELESKGIKNIQVVHEWIEKQMKILGFDSPQFLPNKKLSATL